jgi:hypothetical protein
MPSVTEGKDEGEAENANQDPAVPRRQTNEEASKCTASSFIAGVKLKTWPIGPVKRRSPAAQCRPPNAQINSRIGIGTPSSHSKR